MEFQLSTKKAEESLARLEKSLDSVQGKLSGFSGSTNFESFSKSLAQLQALPPGVATTVKELSAAAASFKNVGSISSFARDLGKLQNLDLSKVATEVHRLAAALSKITLPANISKVITDLRAIGTAGHAAAVGLAAVNKAAKGFTPPAGLAQTVTQLNQVSASAKKASSATAYFGTVAGNMRAGLTALGIATVGRELGQFVSAAYEAQVAFDKFNAVMNNTTGPKTAGNQFKFLMAVARETAMDLQGMTQNYTKFAQASIAGGFSAADTGKMFHQASIAMRGFGLSAVDSDLAMKAITQMMTKGRIQAEELRQQLAERGVPAMAALAAATGKSTIELEKMMEAGKLGTNELKLMIAEMAKMGQGSVTEQLKTIGAQMTMLANNFTMAKLAFGDGFFDFIAIGLANLNAAISGSQAIVFFQTLGEIAGVIGGVLLSAVGLIVTALTSMVGVWRFVYETVLEVWNAFWQSPLGQVAAEVWNLVPAVVTLRDVFVAIGLAVGAFTVGLALYAAGWAAVAVAQGAVLLVSSPLAAALLLVALPILAITGHMDGLIKKFNEFSPVAQEAINKFTSSGESAEDLASKLTGIKDNADQAANGLNNVGNAASASTSGLSSAGSAAASTANIFDELKVSADGAASAIQNVSSAAASAPSSSGGSSGGNSSSGDNPWDGKELLPGMNGTKMWDKLGTGDWSSNWRDGGIVSKGSRSAQRVPTSAYDNAPRFATGGTTVGMPKVLPDGGIPSVLHPNEAVIPLANGSVPVELSTGNGASGGGAGGSNNQLLGEVRRGFSKMHSVLIEINKNSAAANENINQVGVVFKSESDRQIGVLGQHTSLLTDVVTKVSSMETAIKALQTSGTSGGGGSGTSIGGGVGSGGSAADGTWTDQDERDYQAAKTQYDRANRLKGSLTQGGGMTGGFNSKGVSQGVQDKIAKEFGTSRGGYGSAFGGGRAASTALDNDYTATDFQAKQGGGKSFSAGFAKGSPNVLDEAMGKSARVTVHEDEAVIPLPDGRSVPVDLRNMGHTGDGKSGGRGGINVNITVHAKDVDSFKASEEQILQRMQQQMRRAERTLGEVPILDDPTIRPGSR